MWKKCHKTICSIEIFRFSVDFYCWVFKIPISASVLPVFWAFPVLGPIITSLAIAREAIMMGPRTGNAQKTGKTRRKWVFFNSTMEIVRNLKISMLQLAITVGKMPCIIPILCMAPKAARDELMIFFTDKSNKSGWRNLIFASSLCSLLLASLSMWRKSSSSHMAHSKVL